MSDFEDNPFAESYDINPFQDPSVTQVTNSDVDHIDQFNPFPDHQTVSLSGPTIPASRIPSQPAVLQPSTEPGPQVTEAAGQASLLRQQEELEQKAADLEHREKELQNRGTSTGKDNNWPPLPKAFPINPCFYQDFSVEIPMEHRRVCQMLYYLWMQQRCVLLPSQNNAVYYSLHRTTLYTTPFTEQRKLSWGPLCDSVPQPAGLSAPLHREHVLWHELWPVHSLAHPVCPVLLPLLVQTCLQGLQVGQLLQLLLLLLCVLLPSGGVHYPVCGHPQLGKQWLDHLVVCHRLQQGGGSHHDGGGLLLHCLCCAVSHPAGDGAQPVQAYRGQLPEGPAGVLPGRAHQQDLPDGCHLRSRLRCLPGEQLDPGRANSTPRYPLHLLHPMSTTTTLVWDGSPPLLSPSSAGPTMELISYMSCGHQTATKWLLE
ncbi:uncharacterized protein LOC115144696 isoform X1 [Oncorhynchus nerka]|uniref:uncharacterized protein LOC115144696 isoform X1 n=1 Tax=Oncorhynchus nerka TaxID=8023 RepID=UPI0031B8B1D8